nr:protein FAM150B [Pogona vitticeps]
MEERRESRRRARPAEDDDEEEEGAPGARRQLQPDLPTRPAADRAPRWARREGSRSPLRGLRPAGAGGKGRSVAPSSLRPCLSSHHPSAMRGFFWSPALAGLLVLVMLSAAGRCKERTESSAGLKERQNLLNLIMEIIQELKKYHLEEEEENGVRYKQDYLLGRREVPDYGGYSEEQRIEIVPRDLRVKDKFLNHLTGHLYFGPKCTKHFHRLYHHTRDCTIPAYYKRCARLLTRLAVSPMCMEG